MNYSDRYTNGKLLGGGRFGKVYKSFIKAQSFAVNDTSRPDVNEAKKWKEARSVSASESSASTVTLTTSSVTSAGSGVSFAEPKQPKCFATKVIRCRHSDQLRDVKNEIAIMEKIKNAKEDEYRTRALSSASSSSDPLISNPNRKKFIIQLIESFIEPSNKVSYLVLEFISGGELFEKLEKAPQRHFTEELSAKFAYQILNALEFLHSINIVHLDLKPENILCDKEINKIKIADFGIAMDLDVVGENKHIRGTADYMPPEVVNYDNITVQSDIWPFGVILYILLSGMSPFNDEDDSLRLG